MEYLHNILSICFPFFLGFLLRYIILAMANKLNYPFIIIRNNLCGCVEIQLWDSLQKLCVAVPNVHSWVQWLTNSVDILKVLPLLNAKMVCFRRGQQIWIWTRSIVLSLSFVCLLPLSTISVIIYRPQKIYLL